MPIDPQKREAFKGVLQRMIDDGAPEETIREATAKFKAKYQDGSVAIPNPAKIPGWGAPVTPPLRPPDEPEAPPSENPGFLERNMPNTFGPKPKTQKAIRDSSGAVTGYVPVQESPSMLDVAQDLGTWEQRLFGAVLGKTPMNDKEGGFRKEARKEYREWYDTHINEIQSSLSEEERKNLLNPEAWKVWYATRALQAGKITAETWTSLTEAPVSFLFATMGKLVGAGINFAGKVAKGLPKAGKSLVQNTSKLPGPALERAADNTAAVQAAAGTEEELGYQIGDEVMKIRQANAKAFEGEQAATDAAFEARLAQRDQAIQGEVAAQRPGAPLSNPSAISPYESGKSLETAVAGAREAIGQKFQGKLSEAFHQSGISSKPLPKRTLSGEAARQVTGSTKITSQNPMEDFIDESLRRAGYDPSKGYQGSESISEAAVKWAMQRKGFAKNQRTLGHLLKFRRNFQDQLFKDSSGPSALFPRSGQGANDFRFLKSVYDESNALIAELPAKSLPAKEAETFKTLFLENNKEFSSLLGNIESIAEGVGKAADPEDFMKKLQDLPIDDLKAIKTAAAKHPEVEQAVQLVEEMTFDNMIRLALDTKNGNAFSPQKFITFWNAQDPARKVALLGNQRVARINQAIKKYEIPIPKPDKLPAQEPAFPNLAGAGDEASGQRLQARVRNLGTNPNILALRELAFLDNTLGLKGKDSFTERALDAWAAKELGIDAGTRQIPKRNIKSTGYGNAGSVSGAAGGSLLGFLFGKDATSAAIGGLIGQQVGAFSTSPSAAILAYKAFNKVDRAMISPRTISLMKAAARETTGANTLLNLSASFEREIASLAEVPLRRVAEQDRTDTPRYGGQPEKALR